MVEWQKCSPRIQVQLLRMGQKDAGWGWDGKQGLAVKAVICLTTQKTLLWLLPPFSFSRGRGFCIVLSFTQPQVPCSSQGRRWKEAGWTFPAPSSFPVNLTVSGPARHPFHGVSKSPRHSAQPTYLLGTPLHSETTVLPTLLGHIAHSQGPNETILSGF